MDIMDIAIAKALSGGGGSGGAGTFRVNVTFHTEGGAAVIDTIDKTLEDVSEAYNNGLEVVACAGPSVQYQFVLPLVQISFIENQKAAAFAQMTPVVEDGEVVGIVAYELTMTANSNSFNGGIRYFD